MLSESAYQLKPHSLPDARGCGVEDALARDMKALLPHRDMSRVHRREHPHNDLMCANVVQKESVCDIKSEAVIPVATPNF